MKTRKGYLLLVVTCWLSLVAVPGCDNADPSTIDARITQDGVDGVEFGDSFSEIRQKFGDPQVFSHLDGSLRSWFGAGFREGAHAGISVYAVNNIGPPDTLAPVDLFDIRAPFTGKMSSGIGIGSRVEDAFQALGAPEDSIVTELINGSIVRSYYLCMGIRDIELITEADTISVIGLGFHEPLQGWKTQCQK